MSKKGEQTFEVEKIVGKRVYGKKIQYRVHWLGYNSDENTWENEENLNCPDLVEKYNNESTKNEHKTTLKEDSWDKIIKTNPPIKIIGNSIFYGENYLRVQLKDNTYATFPEKFIKAKYSNISK